jgi:hypothetical protein
MMVERYPNLKEEVGSSIPACENLLSTWQKNLLGGQLSPVLWCRLVGLVSPKKLHIYTCTHIVRRRSEGFDSKGDGPML